MYPNNFTHYKLQRIYGNHQKKQPLQHNIWILAIKYHTKIVINAAGYVCLSQRGVTGMSTNTGDGLFYLAVTLNQDYLITEHIFVNSSQDW